MALKNLSKNNNMHNHQLYLTKKVINIIPQILLLTIGCIWGDVNLKEVKIYIRALYRHDIESKPGICKVVMNYSDSTKILIYVSYGMDRDEIILKSLLNGLRKLKSSCMVVVHTEFDINHTQNTDSQFLSDIKKLVKYKKHKIKFKVTDYVKEVITDMFSKEYQTYLKSCSTRSV